MKQVLYIFFLSVLSICCGQLNNDNDKSHEETMTSEVYEDIVKFLSDDNLKGRFPGTPEMKKIEDYVIHIYKKYNIQPIEGSYLQNVPNIPLAKNKSYVNNIWGTIEGVDSNLKNEYVIISAHYDHLGLSPTPVNGDNIFNGARDNALGVAALIKTAIYYATNKPKRSIIFALLTAEEMGLLGSQYMAEHLPVSVDNIVFVYNVDGAGYNDTTKITVVGTQYSNMEQLIFDKMSKTGLTPIKDPVPDLEFFKRSDNISFTMKGIPSITVSQGFVDFGPELQKYYHKVEDEYETLDFKYINKWLEAYTAGSQAVVNSDVRPDWLPSSPYQRKM